MMDCLVLGDSVAEGIAHVRTECVSVVASGIASDAFNRRFYGSGSQKKFAVISLGVNDDERLDTRENLEHIRSKVQADVVYWVVPAVKPFKQAIIRDVARHHGDQILDTSKVSLSNDRIHPTMLGYRQLADQLNK